MLRGWLFRWLARHDAPVLEALSAGPKTGWRLKAEGVLSGWNCYSVLLDMERRGLITSELEDLRDPPRRMYFRVLKAES